MYYACRYYKLISVERQYIFIHKNIFLTTGPFKVNYRKNHQGNTMLLLYYPHGPKNKKQAECAFH